MRASSRMASVFGRPVVEAWERTWPERDERDEAALAAAVRSGHWCSLGSELVERVERRLAELLGVRHVILVGSGTAAITAIALADDLAGGEVIVPAGTFVPGTLGGLLLAGVRPRVVDVDRFWTADVDQVADAIGERTVGIFGVSGMYDRGAEMGELESVGARRGVAVYNDGAHVWGATLDGRLLYRYGRAFVMSFQAHKNVTAGELGAVGTNDDELAAGVRMWRDGGRPEGLGYNFRPNVFAVALLEPQLDRAPEQHRTRDRIFTELREVLRGFDLETAPAAARSDTLPQYELSALMPDGALDGIHRDLVCEGLTYLLQTVVQQPYWGPWHDPKWQGIIAFQRRLQGWDSSYEQAVRDTLVPRPVWRGIVDRGLTFEHALGLNGTAPALVCEALLQLVQHAPRLRELEPLPRPVM